MFYLTTHSTHFIYDYIASNIQNICKFGLVFIGFFLKMESLFIDVLGYELWAPMLQESNTNDTIMSQNTGT